MSPSREEFKLLARELAVDSIVTASLARLLERVITTVVETERARCIKLVRQAADERASDGDPEGAGVILDLAGALAKAGS